ncbi:hypothetical protein, partial [Escherichia coli]
KGWAISHRQKQKKLIMLPSETMIWQPEFTDKTLSRKPGAVHVTHENMYGPERAGTLLMLQQELNRMPLVRCPTENSVTNGGSRQIHMALPQ